MNYFANLAVIVGGLFLLLQWNKSDEKKMKLEKNILKDGGGK